MENNTAEVEVAVLDDYPVDIAPPPEARHYKFWDLFMTFIGGNANASTWYVGGCLAAMGFMRALGVTLIANPIVYLFMGSLGYMGYKVGTTSMGLARVSLGIRGSNVPSVILQFPYLGWCAVNTYVAGISISYILNAVCGLPAYGMPGSNWTMLISIIIQSALTIGAVMIGMSRSVKIFEDLSGIFLVILTIVVTVVVCTTFDLKEIVTWKPDAELRMSMGQGIDNLLGWGLAWITCLAEFTRYTKKVRTAVVSPMLGATFSMVWFVMVGVVSTIAVAVSTGLYNPDASDPSTVVTQLGFGWIAVLVLILSNTTTNVVNFFVGVEAVSNITPKTSKKRIAAWLSVVMVALSIIPLFTGSFLDTFQGFLGLLGALFAPIGTIMMVDFYLLRRNEYDIRFLSMKDGPYWYSNGVNWCGMATMILGAAAYFVFVNIDWMANSLGATAYVMIFSGILYVILYSIGKKRGYYKPIASFTPPQK